MGKMGAFARGAWNKVRTWFDADARSKMQTAYSESKAKMQTSYSENKAKMQSAYSEHKENVAQRYDVAHTAMQNNRFYTFWGHCATVSASVSYGVHLLTKKKMEQEMEQKLERKIEEKAREVVKAEMDSMNERVVLLEESQMLVDESYQKNELEKNNVDAKPNLVEKPLVKVSRTVLGRLMRRPVSESSEATKK